MAQLRILQVLLSSTQECYGLELMKSAKVSSGVLYPMLARLEDKGIIEGRWEDIDESEEGRRRRRYYRLTGEGETVASESINRALADLRAAEFVARRRPGLSGA
jgi:PadR family transcriptional regulator, regulatory protein PadR